MLAKKIFGFAALMLLFWPCCGMLRGDAGVAATFVAYVNVFEPNQRAFIAWGGKEEILVLSTDLQASEATKVLEVVPFPSEPKVCKGETQIFQRAVDLLNKKLPKKKIIGTAGSLGTGGQKTTEIEVPAAEVTFHEKIGATDVNVVHVLEKANFVAWVEKYLKSQKADNPVIPEIMKKSVQEYLDDGYGYFAFNVVSLDKKVKSKEAVQYRFRTDCLFYPMRISRTDKGDTHVDVTVLTRETFDNLTIVGKPEGWLTVEEAIVTASAAEVAQISQSCWDLLGQPHQAKIRVWDIDGELASFDQDIIAGKERTFHLRRNNEVLGPFPLKTGGKVQIGRNVFTIQPGRNSAKDSMGKPQPMQLTLQGESKAHQSSESFGFVDGARVVVGGGVFSLELDKPPVAKDPAARPRPTTKPAATK